MAKFRGTMKGAIFRGNEPSAPTVKLILPIRRNAHFTNLAKRENVSH